MKCIIMKHDQFLWFLARLTGGGRRAARSPLVVIIVVLRVVVLARVNTRLHGELLQIGEAERKREITQHFLQRDSRAATSVGGVSVAWLQPCEIGGAGVALPQVSEEMASAAAVAAKDCYRGEDEAMRGERRARRETKTRKNQIYSQKMQDFFFYIPMFYNRGGGEGPEKKGRLRNAKGNQKLQRQRKLVSWLMIKKCFQATECQMEALCLFPNSLYCFYQGGKKMERKKSSKCLSAFWQQRRRIKNSLWITPEL